MFVFGHIGIGRQIIGSAGRRQPVLPLVFGMLLPDLIDKPLYYARLSTFISGTRTFGHTGLFLGLVLLVAYAAHSRTWLAIAIGMATHGGLDCVIDAVAGRWPGAAFTALTWPILYRHFAPSDFRSPWEHLLSLWTEPIVVFEVIGLTLLAWEYWPPRRRSRRSATEGPGART
jgi:hypothetical protein